MRKLFLVLYVLFMTALVGFYGYTEVSRIRREHAAERSARAANSKAIKEHRAALDALTKLVDALPASEEKDAARLDLVFAEQWLEKADLGNEGSAFSAYSALDVANFWMKMALKNGKIQYSLPAVSPNPGF